MQETRQNDTTAKPNAPGWYQIYFAALLETDQQKAAQLIERAKVAIRERLDDLQFAPAQNPRELQDLGSALTYLEILLDHIGNDGERLLWD